MSKLIDQRMIALEPEKMTIVKQTNKYILVHIGNIPVLAGKRKINHVPVFRKYYKTTPTSSVRHRSKRTKTK